MTTKWRLGIATARFNSLVTERLQQAALRHIVRSGLSEADTLVREVPGSLELPLAAQWLINHGGVDGVICLGAVIRGESRHFDYVCQATTDGLLQVQLTTGKPIGFGVLTCDTMEQALDRAGGKHGNKGIDAAAAVLEMLELRRGLVQGRTGADRP